MNLHEVAEEIALRLTSIFVKDKDGLRPCHGGSSTAEQFLEIGERAATVEVEPPPSAPAGGAARDRGC